MRLHHHPSPFSRPRPNHGIALVLVVIVMALATIMAYTMLSQASLQEQVAANETAAAQSDSLAESGVALAMYYLQKPQNAPSVVASVGSTPAYWAGSTTARFTNLPGSANINISYVGASGTTGMLYNITSTGSGVAAGGGNFTKTVSASALVNAQFQANQAITSNSNVVIGSGMSVSSGGNSALSVKGTVSVSNGGSLSGPVAASSVSTSGSGVWNSRQSLPAPASSPVPTIANVRSYQSYTYQGTTYNAGSLLTWLLNLITNPLSILYSAGNVTVNGKTLTGMVYVPNGSLTISGNVTITAPAGYPAMVVGQQILMSPSSHLVVNGMVYAGQGFKTPSGVGTGTSVTINGGLMTDSGGNLSGAYAGTLGVTYNAANTSIPDFTTNIPNLTPQSVKLVSWSP